MLLREGDLDAAEAKAREGLAVAGGLGDVEWRWNLIRLLAERSLLLVDAETAVRQLEPVLEESGWKRHEGFNGTLAWAYAAHGRIAEAEKWAAHAIDLARRC